jgi:MFS family permease
MHVYSLGPFVEPLQEAFGWSRAQVLSGLTVTSLISTAFCIPIGILVDRIGPRALALTGLVAMTGAYVLLSTATGSFSNWLFLWGVVALGTLGVHATVWTSAVASRFEASRGLALAVTLSGASVSAAVFPFLVAWLIDRYDWRSAFAALGGLWALIVFPLLFFFFRGRRDVGVSRGKASAQPDMPGVSLREGLRSLALYKLFLAAGLFAFTIMGAVVHFVPILKDAGAAPLEAARIASLIGIFSVVGRLGTGALLDKFAGHRVGAIAFLIPVAACALLVLDGADPVSQMLAAIFLGLSVGSEIDVIAYLTARHFGLRNFGALYGVLNMALGTGLAFGPMAAGMLFDRFGNYTSFLILTIVTMSASALAILSLGAPPKTPAERVQAPSIKPV